jgi:hypothetical protein
MIDPITGILLVGATAAWGTLIKRMRDNSKQEEESEIPMNYLEPHYPRYIDSVGMGTESYPAIGVGRPLMIRPPDIALDRIASRDAYLGAAVRLAETEMEMRTRRYEADSRLFESANRMAKNILKPGATSITSLHFSFGGLRFSKHKATY